MDWADRASTCGDCDREHRLPDGPVVTFGFGGLGGFYAEFLVCSSCTTAIRIFAAAETRCSGYRASHPSPEGDSSRSRSHGEPHHTNARIPSPRKKSV